MSKKRFDKIYIEITNVCNLNCSFCLQDKRVKTFMKLEEFEEIIFKIKDYTKLITLHVKGEPLLHPNLKGILEICEKYNIMVNITTNGSLINKNVKILSNSKALRQLNISIHSITDPNILYGVGDILKFQEKYMNDIFNSLEYIKNKNNPYVSFRFWNIKDIQEKNKNKYLISLISKNYNKINLLEEVEEKNNIKIADKIYLNCDFVFNWPDLNAPKISDTGTCHGLRNQLAILANGDVVPCCLDQDSNILLGNIFNSDINSILNGEKSQKIIKGFQANKLTENLCQRCDYIKKFN